MRTNEENRRLALTLFFVGLGLLALRYFGAL